MDNNLYNLLNNATSQNPVCRFEYKKATGKNERKFRAEIAEMRMQGIRIVSSSNGKGYWIAKSEEEYITFRKQQMSRICKISKTIKAMDGNLNGQESLLEDVYKS